jgi:hypothetical protein
MNYWRWKHYHNTWLDGACKNCFNTIDTLDTVTWIDGQTEPSILVVVRKIEVQTNNWPMDYYTKRRMEVESKSLAI